MSNIKYSSHSNVSLNSMEDGDHANKTIIHLSEISLPVFAKCVIGLLYAVIIIIGVGGNSIVCYIVLAHKKMRTVTNYFIVNLALSDVLMAIICIPFSVIANMLVNFWPFGAVMCPIVLFSQVVAVLLSAFTLVAISVDRYIAIMIPLRPKMTTRQAIIVIVTIWILSCSISAPVAYLSEIDERKVNIGNAVVLQKYCVENWTDTTQSFDYSMVIMSLQYFLPLIVLIFTYSRIGIVIWVKQTPGEAVNHRDQRMAKSKRKMVKMMITVVMIYALCWLPLHAVTLVGELSPDGYNTLAMRITWITCQMLAMSNSCCNPVVYCWMNATYRNGFREVLRFCPFVKYGSREDENMSRSNTVVTQVRSGYYDRDGYQSKQSASLRKTNSSVYKPSSTVVAVAAMDSTSLSSNGGHDNPAEYVPLRMLSNGQNDIKHQLQSDYDEYSEPGYD